MAQITPQLIDAVIRAESNNNPNAISPKGAIGLMQIMPATAAQYGVSPEQLRDPRINRELGTRILTDLYNKYSGNLPAAISAYNEGSGALDKGRYPTETRNYLSRITGFMGPSEASAGEIDPRIQQLMSDPRYVALTKSDPDKAKQIMDIAQQRANASPMDPTAKRFGASGKAVAMPKLPEMSSAKPLDLGGSVGTSGTWTNNPPPPETFSQAMNRTIANQSFANLGPRIDTGLGKIKGTSAAASNAVFGQNWGPTLDPGQLVPSTGPELAGQLAMTSMAGPILGFGEMAPALSTYLEEGAVKAPGAISRLLLPPAVAAGTAAVSGDPNTDPFSAGASTALGTLTGLGTEAGQTYLRGKAGSPRVAGVLREDVRKIGTKLSEMDFGTAGNALVNTVKKPLTKASQFIHFFTGTAQDKWGSLLKRADAYKAEADALEAKLESTHVGKGTSDRWVAETKIKEWRAKEGELRAQYDRLAKPFIALQQFFGRPENWDVEGYQEFLSNIPNLQKFLRSDENVAMMREAGIPMSAIDDMRRIAWGKNPGTVATEVMTEKDVEAKSIGGGLRGHAYHGFPTFSTHLSFPEMAKLAGDRQKAIQANKMWGLVSGYLMDRYINSLGDPTEYGDSQATAGNTGMSEGPTGATH